jgi:hypothetical protein
MRLAGEALRRAELEDADHTARSFNAIYRQVSHDRVGVAETPTAEKPDLQR